MPLRHPDAPSTVLSEVLMVNTTLRTAALVVLLSSVAAGQVSPARFDHAVRADFFAGFSGNDERLQRGMAVCEAVLAENPRHAEALVWHGSGLLVQSRGA